MITDYRLVVIKSRHFSLTCNILLLNPNIPLFKNVTYNIINLKCYNILIWMFQWVCKWFPTHITCTTSLLYRGFDVRCSNISVQWTVQIWTYAHFFLTLNALWPTQLFSFSLSSKHKNNTITFLLIFPVIKPHTWRSQKEQFNQCGYILQSL